jgi:hypothetical protein
MNIIEMLFGGLFRAKKQAYVQRAKADLHRNTVGKVNGRVMQASARVDNAVYGAQKKASKTVFGGGAKGAGSKQQQAQQKRQPAQAPAKGGPKMKGKAPKGAKGQGKMGLFGSGDKNQGRQQQQHQGPYCPNGHPVDPSWDACPACMQMGLVAQGGSGGGMAQQPQGGMANYSQGDARTQAIDVRGLESKTKKSVVGWIVAQNGNHRGMDFRLYDGKNVIGTAADCDIVVTDPFLSARQCTVRCEGGNFVVIDLDSKNGTYVNQKRVSKEELIDNDTIRLGKTEFKFKSLY